MTIASQWLRTRLREGVPVAAVEIVETKGSTPRGSDAFMLVSRDELTGTIGGGTLEYMAIDAARDWIAGKPDADSLALPLGPVLGQCCGGHVTLRFLAADAAYLQALEERTTAAMRQRPQVVVFGAGHVGRALAQALAPLPLATAIVDTRAKEIAAVPAPVSSHVVDQPDTLVGTLQSGAAVVILTHSHAMDFSIGETALRRGDLAYVGMIGSKTKRAHFRSWLLGRGHDAHLIDRLVLPIGGSRLRDKRPEVIAALTAAEIATVLLAEQPSNL